MNLKKSKEFLELIDVAKENKFVIAVVLFGSYVKGEVKPNSDIDVCIIAKKDARLEDLSDIRGYSSQYMDVLFYHNLTDVMKFRIFSEGEILALNDKKEFLRLRKKFLHIYRDNYLFYMKNMKRMLANV
jgi:predicted nucleotidyltransferase